MSPLTAAADSKRASVMAKALSYDESLPERAKNQVQVAILYMAGNGGSESQSKEWESGIQEIASVKVQGMTLASARYAFGAGTAAELKKTGASVLVVCDGLSGQLSQIQSLAASLKSLTVANARKDSEKGMALGVFIEGGKPKIVINLQGVKNDRVKFSTKLIAIAEVLR